MFFPSFSALPRATLEVIVLNGLVGLLHASLEGTKTEYVVVEDRREAIYSVLKLAKSGDIVVLAGKGHEDYQILKNNVHIHFDEREVVAEGLKRLD